MYELNLYLNGVKKSYMIKDYVHAKDCYKLALKVIDRTGISLKRPDGTLILYSGTIDFD